MSGGGGTSCISADVVSGSVVVVVVASPTRIGDANRPSADDCIGAAVSITLVFDRPSSIARSDSPSSSMIDVFQNDAEVDDAIGKSCSTVPQNKKEQNRSDHSKRRRLTFFQK